MMLEWIWLWLCYFELLIVIIRLFGFLFWYFIEFINGFIGLDWLIYNLLIDGFMIYKLIDKIIWLVDCWFDDL